VEWGSFLRWILHKIVELVTAERFESASADLREQTDFRFVQVVDLGSMIGRCYCKHPIRYEFWVEPVDKPLAEVIPAFQADNPAVRGRYLVVGSSCIKEILGLADEQVGNVIKLYQEALAVRDEVAKLALLEPDWYERHDLEAVWPAVGETLPRLYRRLGGLLFEARLPFPAFLLEKVMAEYGRGQQGDLEGYMEAYLKTGLKCELFESCLERLRAGLGLSDKQVAAISLIREQAPDVKVAAIQITEQRKLLLRLWRLVGREDSPTVASLLQRVSGGERAAVPLTEAQVGLMERLAEKYGLKGRER
jgi:hypothetical protein